MKTMQYLWTILFTTFAAGAVFAQNDVEPGGPGPITILGERNQVTIPDVPRDKVIGFALYTVEKGILKLSAQLYPLRDGESRQVQLEIKDADAWREVASADVDGTGWLATFRVEGWDQAKDFPYRVTHADGSVYEGIIRRDPINKNEIVVAAFTGNSNRVRGGREDIIDNIKSIDPDVLFFSGDQSYDHDDHTAAWLLFGRQFGEIMKDRPTITIPDDHDVGHGNLWGEGGKVAKLSGAADGGYKKPAAYVNMVQRAQTAHLPDPYDPTPIKQGIGVYYTSMNVGGIGLAIIEDRKWKTGPAGLVPEQGPRPDHVNDPEYDRASLDLPEARLLGERQLKFLHQWGQDWSGTEMKTVLSQTIFAGGAHFHGKSNNRVLADLDSNGWPQSGRARALEELRRFFGFHIAGDQHLATVIHHGINAWEDSGYSFCVPSIVNFYGRWWWPLEAPLEHNASNPLPFTGRYYDGFDNKLTMQAYANPTGDNENGAGFGIVRFDKASRQITMENWPRHVDVSQDGAEQYPGWPVTISQQDNYGRQPLHFLPTLQISGQEDPVIQVIDEYLDSIVYTIRINGNTWRPKVFREASYTIKIGEGESIRTLQGVKSISADQQEVLKVEF